MSKFTGELAVSYRPDALGRNAYLLEPLIWECDELGSGILVTVPAGFSSDGASVPRWLWWLMPAWGDRGTRAAILHDYLLEMFKSGTSVAGLDTREKCDQQFFQALLALGVENWRAHACYLGVSMYSFYWLTMRDTFGVILA